MATAALAHYDALFFLPPIVLVILWRTGWRGLLDYDELSPWLRGAAAGRSRPIMLSGAGLVVLMRART